LIRLEIEIVIEVEKETEIDEIGTEVGEDIHLIDEEIDAHHHQGEEHLKDVVVVVEEEIGDQLDDRDLR
jgi:hypothetical protein